MKIKRYLKIMVGSLAIVGLAFARSHPQIVHAASTITVNSKADSASNDGVCTLREAIIAANSDTTSGAAGGECVAGSGADTIIFSITGSADFVNGGQNGYTIAPNTALPTITTQMTINGYSQSGAAVNTAVSPAPLNGKLLIQIDGQNASGNPDGIILGNGSDNSIIRGLVINNFDGNGVPLSSTNVSILGNYIGTDPTGLIGRPNNGGVTSNLSDSPDDALIGGTVAASRNLLSGNLDFGIAPRDGWIIQGNYVGIAADGITALGNHGAGGSGGITIDDCDGVVVGGSVTGAANIVSGNWKFGISPDRTTNLTIQGNLIGTDYTGMHPVGNLETGILLSASSDAVIGGTTVLERNVVSNNGQSNSSSNIALTGAIGSSQDGVTVLGNYIGVDITGVVNPSFTNSVGIYVNGQVTNVMIGGQSGDEGNIIANAAGGGIVVSKVNVPSFGISFGPTNISMLSNKIYDIQDAPLLGFGSSNLGIDLLMLTVDGSFIPSGVTGSGTNPNDPDGNIPGEANDYINHPVITGFTQNGTSGTVTYDLNAAGSDIDMYHVEFFANDDSSASGKTYLGFANVSPGTGLTNPYLIFEPGFDMAGKYITATATEMNDDQDVNYGFGSTSEFSAPYQVLAAQTTTSDSENGAPAQSNTGALAATGRDTLAPVIVGVFLTSLCALITLLARRRYRYIYRR
jgi:CSLREA domain-containing protein